MAAYVLADELELPHKEIAEILQAQNSTVASYIRQIKSKLATNPSMHLEIDRLKPQNAASISMAGRIIRLVMKRYEVTLDDIASNDQTRQLNKARAATIDLMVNRAGYSAKQASQILGMSEAVVANLAIQR